uniref:Uncharacterized protein n=1 Tax=Glossina austeni TaxID=7395 RepID=A0A1A9VQX4_GLOAU
MSSLYKVRFVGLHRAKAKNCIKRNHNNVQTSIPGSRIGPTMNSVETNVVRHAFASLIYAQPLHVQTALPSNPIVSARTHGIHYTMYKCRTTKVLKQQRDLLKRYQTRIELSLENDRQLEKQQDIDSLLSEAISEWDENYVLKELDALVAEEKAKKLKLPEVPQDELSRPSAERKQSCH